VKRLSFIGCVSGICSYDGYAGACEVGLLGLVSNTCCASLAVYEKSYADIS